MNRRNICFSGRLPLLRNCFLVAAMLAVAVPVVAQQGTSIMVGTVSDPTRAVIPGAILTATEQTTGTAYTAISNESGQFRFNSLRRGKYRLHIEISGFKSYDVADIDLLSAETRDLGTLILQLGALTESVEVIAQATPVQTASSERSLAVLQEQLQDLSLKGRDPFGMVQLLPGVVDTFVGKRERADAYAMNYISMSGMTAQSKNVTIDGVNSMDAGADGTLMVTPNLESVAEMRVMTNGYQAEYGKKGGGAINVVTKSGGREFHGSAHLNKRHENLTANTFFNNRSKVPKPIYRYLMTGYGFGGPVYIPKVWNSDRRRMFFFISQEFTRIAQPTNNTTANMPTDAELSGDFSKSVNSAGKLIPVIDPLNGKQFPNNIVPPTRIDPVGLGILKLFPRPNGYVNPAPGQRYTSNFLSTQTPFYERSNTIIRFDSNLTDKLSMWYRYGKDTDNNEYSFSVAPGLGTSVRQMPGFIHGVHLGYTINPTTVYEFLFGTGHTNYGFYHPSGDSAYLRTSNLNPPTLRPFPTGDLYLPFMPCAFFSGGQASGMPYYTPGSQQGGGSCQLNPYKNANDNWVFHNDLSKIWGSHSFKAGTYTEYNSKVEPSAGSTYAGNFNFGSTTNNPIDSGYGYANALMGIFQSYSEASNRALPNLHYWQIDGYVQDSWRVSKRFTLDLGLRLIHTGEVKDDAGTYSNFYTQLYDPQKAARLYWPATVGGKSVAIDRATGATTYYSLVGTLVPGTGDAVNGMHIDGLEGKGDFYYLPNLAFAPRVGFAWDVTGDSKTAVRGSFGMFYNRTTNSVAGNGAPPVVYTPTIYYSRISDIAQAGASAVISPTAPTMVYGDQKLETVYQFNLTVQRAVGFSTVVDLGYVGNFDRHAPETVPMNDIAYQAYKNPANLFNNTPINANLLRTRYPGMGAIGYTSYSRSLVNYHALQMSAQHRLTHGLAFGAAYTFSKALGTQGNDSYNNSRKWYYGPIALDRTHLMTWNFAYNLPAPKQSWLVRSILGGFTLSGMGIITTGAPVTPTCSSTAPFPYSDPGMTGLGTNSITGNRCAVVGDPDAFTHDFYNNFNTKSFALAQVGTFGNVGVGTLRQPAWWNFDLALDKKMLVRERVALRVRVQAYNVFNHTEFNTIGTTYSFNAAGANLSTTTGQYTATQPPRQMAISARIEF